MTIEKLKKAVVSGALAAGFILSCGLVSNSTVVAQDRYHRWNDRREQHDRGWERRRELEEMGRIRVLDREHRLRYRTNNSTRIVGYYDRYGRFHAYGYYDRFGFFHRY
jgi:hypothetical protein